MTVITLARLDEAGWGEYASWFADAELRRRVEPPTPQWYDYVRQTPGCYAWVARGEDTGVVGMVQPDIGPELAASIMLVVRPDVRGRGYGRAVLRALVQLPEVAEVRSIEAMIAADNLASVRCFAAAGFVAESDEPDKDGFVKLVYRRTD